MPKIIAVMVLCNEGELARQSLEKISVAGDRLVVIHDGPANDETRKLVDSVGGEFYEYQKQGCKEPHLALFLSKMADKPHWCLHVDSDEVLSDELVDEIRSLPLGKPAVYHAELVHVKADRTILRYRKGASKSEKPILFHVDVLSRVLSLPHGGMSFRLRPARLVHQVRHKAIHLEHSLSQRLDREKRFAHTDAKLRTRSITIFKDRKLLTVEPSDSSLGRVHCVRYQYPLLALLPAMLYSLKLCLVWLLEARSWSAFIVELRMTIVRPLYQVYLCLLIFRYKRQHQAE